jgi:hypothetical protein
VLPRFHNGRCRPSSVGPWNRSAPGRWTALHRAAADYARRRHGGFWVATTVAEMQKRGALHWHVVLPFGTPADRAAARTYARRLHERSRSHGFGFVDRKLRTYSAEHAARYLGSYFSGGRGSKRPLSESVKHPDMPRRPVYVARRLTSTTGVTMRRLRQRRYRWVLQRQRVHQELSYAVATIIAGRPPPFEQLALVADVERLVPP